MNARSDRRAWFAAVALVWVRAWLHLSAEWLENEQYRYGFGVPFLFAWMAWRRRNGAMRPGARTPAWWCALAIAMLALILGESLRRHDPLWRFTGAMLTAAAAMLTAAWLHRLGGTPLLRREIFPLAFAALAVPWPVPLESWITQHLATFVTDIAVTAVNTLGVAALQRGNVIELANGSVGVDEACSGIQSLQAVLMAAFFLGEFFALRTVRRAALVLAGCAAALAANCLRIIALTLVTRAHGQSAVLAWHDPVGASATLAVFTLLLGIAWKMSGDSVPEAVKILTHTEPPRTFEGRCVLAAAAGILVSVCVWFSAVKSRHFTPGAQPWMLTGSRLPGGWTSEFIPPTRDERASLRFSDWQCLRVRNPVGITAQIVRLAWESGVRMPAFVTNHTPAVCLPSAGWTPSEPPFLLTLKIRGGDFPCAAYPFTRDGARLIALQNLSADGRTELRLVDPAKIPGTLERLATLWQKPLRQITGELLLYLPDPGETEARKKSAAEFLEAVLVQREK